MFKKTLLAVALSTATLAANAATTITTSLPGAAPISNQGLPATKAYTLFDDANDALPLDGGSVILTLKGADNTGIVDNGRLVITVSGALFTNPALALAAVGGTLVNETVVVNAAESTSTTLVFDLAANADDWTVVDNDTISIGNIALQITGTDVKFSSVFQSATKTPFATTAGAAVSVAKATDQWVAAVTADASVSTSPATKLDAQIDVGDNRESFTTGSSDAFTFDIETSGSGATLNSMKATIDGDFSGVKSVVAVNSGTATYTINSAKTQATYTYTGATDTTVTEVTTAPSVVTVSVETAADKVAPLETRSFDLTLDVDYDDAESVQNNIELLTAADAGSWTLNGVTDNTNYVPFGPNTALIFQATSTFAEDAMMSVSYLNETTGKMVSLNNIATVKANSVTKLGKVISDAIIADSGMASGKTKISVTVNAPTGKVTFFKGFKDTSDKDRLGL